VLKADENQNALFEEGVTEAYGKQFGPQIYATYLELFRALPVVLRAPNRVVICHSLPNARVMSLFAPARLEEENYEPADLAPGGTVHALLWGRDTSQENAEAFLQKMEAHLLVSGHIAYMDGFDIPNDRQVIIDCAETPASYLLFPADRPLTQPELIGCLKTI